MLKCAPETQKNYLVLVSPQQPEYEAWVAPYVEKVYYMDIPTWQKYRRNTWLEKLRAPFGDAYRVVQLIPAVISLLKIIKAEKINLAHTNTSITPVGALAAWIARVPHIWHIREPFGSKNQYEPILGNAISFWIIKKLSKSIICNSIFTAEPFFDRGIPTVVIQNGLDLAGFINDENRQSELRSRYAIKEEDLLIGMVGNLTTNWKRHDIFLEIAANLSKDFKKLKFIVFGASPDLDQTEYTRGLKQQASHLGISDKVIWAEFIDDTVALMDCIDILIHPAVNEGSGRVIMEAMAAGKPVIAMDSGGVRELIIDGETGFLVNPDNTQEIYDRVSMLIGDTSLQKAIGQKAKEYAHSHFSDWVMMSAIEKIYQDLNRSNEA